MDKRLVAVDQCQLPVSLPVSVKVRVGPVAKPASERFTDDIVLKKLLSFFVNVGRQADSSSKGRFPLIIPRDKAEGTATYLGFSRMQRKRRWFGPRYKRSAESDIVKEKLDLRLVGLSWLNRLVV